MARIEKSIEIEAPVDKVFDFVAAEWEKKMSFFEGIYDWRLTSGKTMGDGAKCAYKVKILGTETEIEKEVSGFVKNKEWTATSFKGPESRAQLIFAPIDSKTRFTYILEYKVPIRIIGGLLDALVIKKQWETSIDKSLQNLKRLMERS